MWDRSERLEAVDLPPRTPIEDRHGPVPGTVPAEISVPPPSSFLSSLSFEIDVEWPLPSNCKYGGKAIIMTIVTKGCGL